MTHYAIEFPPARRHPFDIVDRQSSAVPVNPVFAVWPVGGSADGPAVQPPTIIPIDSEQVEVLRCGTEPMLVNSNGQSAQYRIATGGLVLTFGECSRPIEPTEKLFVNLQLIGNLNGGDFVLANAYPDMAQVYTSFSQATSLNFRRVEFPALTTPAGTVVNTVGMRVIMFLRDSSLTARSPFWFSYTLNGALAVADPIVGPCADNN